MSLADVAVGFIWGVGFGLWFIRFAIERGWTVYTFRQADELRKR